MGFYWAVRVYGQFKPGRILLLIIMPKCAFGFHCFQMLGREKKTRTKEISFSLEFFDVLPTFQHKKKKKKQKSVEFNGHKDAGRSVKRSSVILTREITCMLYAERLDSLSQIKKIKSPTSLIVSNTEQNTGVYPSWGFFFHYKHQKSLSGQSWSGTRIMIQTAADMLDLTILHPTFFFWNEPCSTWFYRVLVKFPLLHTVNHWCYNQSFKEDASNLEVVALVLFPRVYRRAEDSS